jgi:hypothetical protein
MSLTLKRSLKTKFVGEHTETYVVFECLACNLLQISPLILKLCLRSQDFFKMCSQNAGNASVTPILKISQTP